MPRVGGGTKFKVNKSDHPLRLTLRYMAPGGWCARYKVTKKNVWWREVVRLMEKIYSWRKKNLGDPEENNVISLVPTFSPCTLAYRFSTFGSHALHSDNSIENLAIYLL